MVRNKTCFFPTVYFLFFPEETIFFPKNFLLPSVSWPQQPFRLYS